MAPQHEYHHYYRRSAIFIYNIGLPDDDSATTATTSTSLQNYVIRGLILDHPTPFTWKEMIPGRFDDSPLGDELLYRGGDRGGDGVLLLHNNKIQHGTDAVRTADTNEIGPGSGIYQGGWDAAVAAVHAGTADVEDFKAFFNFCEFSELELEAMLESEEGGDGWASVEVDSSIVLSTDWDRGGCWKRLRNAIAQHMQQS